MLEVKDELIWSLASMMFAFKLGIKSILKSGARYVCVSLEEEKV